MVNDVNNANTQEIVGVAQSAVRQVAGPKVPAPLAGDWVAMPY